MTSTNGPTSVFRDPGVMAALHLSPRLVTTLKFVVKKCSDGEFRFDLGASNGQVVATSKSYKQKASALSTIGSIQKNAGAAPVDDQTDA